MPSNSYLLNLEVREKLVTGIFSPYFPEAGYLVLYEFWYDARRMEDYKLLIL